MNAVIKVGGKQYYVTEGSEIFVEKLNANAGDVVKFDQVLMLDSKIGSPYLTNVTVEGKVIKNGRLVPLLELGAGFDPQDCLPNIIRHSIDYIDKQRNST